MKNIMLVSKGYNEILEKLGTRFSFTVQIYSNCNMACGSIPTVSINNYLGFAFIDDEIEDINSLQIWLHKINLMVSGGGSKCRRKVVIATRETPKTLANVIRKKKPKITVRDVMVDLPLDYIDILSVQYNILTDWVVNHEIFGSLLLDMSQFILEDTYIPPVMHNDNPMRLTPLFPQKFLDVFDKLTSISTDLVLDNLKENDRILYDLRIYRYTKSDDLLKKIKITIENLSYRDKLYYDLVLNKIIGGD